MGFEWSDSWSTSNLASIDRCYSILSFFCLGYCSYIIDNNKTNLMWLDTATLASWCVSPLILYNRFIIISNSVEFFIILFRVHYTSIIHTLLLLLHYIYFTILSLKLTVYCKEYGSHYGTILAVVLKNPINVCMFR